jgi:hypothetical protein
MPEYKLIQKKKKPCLERNERHKYRRNVREQTLPPRQLDTYSVEEARVRHRTVSGEIVS